MKRGGPIKARRRSRTKAEQDAYDTVMQVRSQGICEVCGRCPATNYQHRKAVAQGGPTTVVNGLAVCGMGNASGCHGRIHQNPTEAYGKGWSVKRGLDPLTSPVRHARYGLVLFREDGSVQPAEGGAAA